MKTAEGKNLTEFIALIKRYESITVEEIIATGEKEAPFALRELTGFGTGYCTLCRSANDICGKCIWLGSCTEDKTYGDLGLCDSLDKAPDLLKARADYMRKYLKLNYDVNV